MKNKILQEQKLMLSLMRYDRGATSFENEQLNEWALALKILGKAGGALRNLGKGAKFLKSPARKIFEAALETQGKTAAQMTEMMANYTSRASGKAVDARAVIGLLKKASEESYDTFMKNLDDMMRLVPREVLDKTTNKVIAFREPYKKYLKEIAEEGNEMFMKSKNQAKPRLRGTDGKGGTNSVHHSGSN